MAQANAAALPERTRWLGKSIETVKKLRNVSHEENNRTFVH